MKAFCTLSDSDFLPFGLAMYESLMKFDDNFTLFYLCTDKEAYDILDKNEKRWPNITPILLDELLEECPELADAKHQKPSFEAENVAKNSSRSASDIQFFWCLSAFFAWYCLDKFELEEVLYIDSDIFFFNDWNLIFEEIGDASIGLVRHRIPYNPAVGEFNVGIVYFRNDLDGYKAAWSWKMWLTGEDTQYRETHGACGDQVYLELFPQFFADVRIIDQKVGHLAPWNIESHIIKGKDKVIWNDVEQPLVYFHFSNFKPDYSNNDYDPAPRHGLTRRRQYAQVRYHYDKYFTACKKQKEVVDLLRCRL